MLGTFSGFSNSNSSSSYANSKNISINWNEFSSNSYKTFKAAEILIEENKKSKFIYIIQEGTVSLSYTNLHKDNIFFDVAGPGDILGLSSCILDINQSITASALQDVKCIRIDCADFNYHLSSNKKMLPDLLKLISIEAERKEKKLYGMIYKSVYQRLGHVANKLYEYFGLDNSNRININLSIHKIAELVNTKPASLYTAIKKLRHDKILYYDSGYIIVLSELNLKKVFNNDIDTPQL